ncbi:MAG: NAD(P)H-binding protein, partial [Bacteroidales bacterium]|nr:NAD(P)H-binding protein [Bacteroidales bacterium]
GWIQLFLGLSMKVAVTTASGQLGRAIIQALIQEIGKENVVGIARTPEKAADLGIEIRKGDYNSFDDFYQALQDREVVLLVSGMDHPDKRIDQHRNVIHAAKEAGVRKIVYTSIFGKEGSSTFDAIVNSNRQTERDIQESGMEWAIGRNGLYIEPDVESIETYKKEGKIANSAGDGLASYTTRGELAYAYSQMILHDDRNGRVFNLAGQPMTQLKLTEYLNRAFGTNLTYEAISPEAYLEIQQKTNGEFLGMIISGIYNKIRNGETLMDSTFMEAAGREHITWEAYFG